LLHGDDAGAEEAREPGLTTTVAPDLGHDGCRSVKRDAVRDRELDEASELAVVPFEGDQRAGIED
jgi:hypothetical protein